MQSGIAPQHLLNKLSTSMPDTQSQADKLVLDTILSNNPADIDNLLDHKLKFLKNEIGLRTKEMVIDYIYDRWQMDRTWVGTVKPMKWFDTYFEFFSTEKQFIYLLEVFKELTASSPSFEALTYTSSVVRKISPEILSYVSEAFIKYCAERVLSSRNKHDDLVLSKLEELKISKLIRDKSLNKFMESIIQLSRDQLDEADYETTKDELEAFAYPELAEIKKKRREKRRKA
jgi:hypothetical protein